MEKSSITVNVDAQTKKNTEKIFQDLGFNMTTGVNMFLKAVERYQGIPFELELNSPNQTSLEALREVRENLDNLKTYNNFDEIIDEIDRELANENQDIKSI